MKTNTYGLPYVQDYEVFYEDLPFYVDATIIPGNPGSFDEPPTLPYATNIIIKMGTPTNRTDVTKSVPDWLYDLLASEIEDDWNSR